MSVLPLRELIFEPKDVTKLDLNAEVIDTNLPYWVITMSAKDYERFRKGDYPEWIHVTNMEGFLARSIGKIMISMKSIAEIRSRKE